MATGQQIALPAVKGYPFHWALAFQTDGAAQAQALVRFSDGSTSTVSLNAPAVDSKPGYCVPVHGQSFFNPGNVLAAAGQAVDTLYIHVVSVALNPAKAPVSLTCLRETSR